MERFITPLALAFLIAVSLSDTVAGWALRCAMFLPLQLLGIMSEHTATMLIVH